MGRVAGIELASQVPQTCILPMNYTRHLRIGKDSNLRLDEPNMISNHAP